MCHIIIGRRIRAFRRLKGYTQQQLADELGMSVAIVGAVERGTRTASQQLLAQIATVLHITVEELLPSGDEYER
ncbi:helix-turn-helix domain-containing protein [Numidum massiliense]|uniref:helix-turn-helix domain-containing protein n=1 Tax=Numidum massiliense TaxID=1522315 RepID=UPI0006D544D5|nr:helix-turn-helix transcriptional regulator [Numidum massiliense]